MAITSIFNKLQNLIPHNTYPKPASYLANDEFNYRSNEELKIWGYKDTLGISQIKYTDIMNELDGVNTGRKMIQIFNKHRLKNDTVS